MRNKEFTENLAIFSLIMIPILTLTFATHKSPFEYTFSMVGNWFDIKYRTRFIIWGALTGIFLTYFLIYIYKKTKFKNKKAFRYLYASTISLLLTVITPTITKEFVPKEMRTPTIDPHFIYGISFAILLIISLYLFSKHLYENQYTHSNATKLFLISIAVPFIILIIFGMTGLFEIAFFVSIFIFLWIVNKDITEKIN